MDGKAGAGQRRQGFRRASRLLKKHIRSAGESRGFAVSRLLTHWSEIVGDEIASMARPVKVTYGRGSFGATLTLLASGAQAPLLQAELPRIRERVNACYGYNAISRIRVTQTAPQGFAEGQTRFEPPRTARAFAPAPQVRASARKTTAGVRDETLREALTTLGEHILSRSTNHTRPNS